MRAAIYAMKPHSRGASFRIVPGIHRLSVQTGDLFFLLVVSMVSILYVNQERQAKGEEIHLLGLFHFYGAHILSVIRT